MFEFSAMAPAKTLTPNDAHKLAQKGEIQLVDVREASEWVTGRVPGAIHVPLSSFIEGMKQLSEDRPIAFYCLSGARSAQAVQICQRLGFGHDTHMAGGITAWKLHGLPVER